MPRANTETRPGWTGLVFNGLARAAVILAGATLVALVGLVFAEAVARAVFNASLDIVEELVGYFVVQLTFLGAALALRKNELFQVSFLTALLPDRAARMLRLVYILAALGVCGLFAWKTAGLVISSLERGKISQTVLETPLWIPQIALPFGFCVLGLFVLEHLLTVLREVRKGDA